MTRFDRFLLSGQFNRVMYHVCGLLAVLEAARALVGESPVWLHVLLTASNGYMCVTNWRAWKRAERMTKLDSVFAQSRWFGESWGAAICDPRAHTVTPVDKPCAWCDEPFVHGDQGVTNSGQAWHLDCHLRAIVGGANHQLGTCTCCGGADEPDPPGLSKRDAAKLARHVYDTMHNLKPAPALDSDEANP
jgi:hypothetical protein